MTDYLDPEVLRSVITEHMDTPKEELGKAIFEEKDNTRRRAMKYLFYGRLYGMSGETMIARATRAS